MKSGRRLGVLRSVLRGRILQGQKLETRGSGRFPFPATFAVATVLAGALAPHGLWDGLRDEMALHLAARHGPATAAPATLGGAPALQPVAPVALRPSGASGDAAGAPLVTTGVVAPGGTLAGALRSHGVGPRTVHRIVEEMRSLVDFRSVRPGDRFRLSLAPDGALREFVYTDRRGDSYRLAADGDGFVAEEREQELVRRTARVAGVIRSSLYEAIVELGESGQLAGDFAEIFQYDVDFAHGIRRGDEFQMLYERVYRVGAHGRETYLRPGRVLAARYRGAQGDHAALYYEQEPGRGGYFRPDGSPVQRTFLAAPLKYSRVTSRFTHSRLHPILDVRRPHLGIDYAAPTGTPLWSVADGEVIFKGWAGGFGRMVKVRHANGYVSFYPHLSRFPRGLDVGDRVRQKQVVGFVGSSGLATGPHVCFRIQKDGKYVNPASLRGTALTVESLAGDGAFQEARATLLADLQGRSLVTSVEEAL